VVDIEKEETGELIRRDCYDPNGGAAEPGDVLCLQEGEVWTRSIRWARSQADEAEVTVAWEPTGLSWGEVRVGVYTWPIGKPVRVSIGRAEGL
jgi:hypothetical protein